MSEVEESPSLEELYKRFLAKVLAAARAAGEIDNAGLFKKFPQKRLFEAYKDEPKSRAKLLAENSKMPFEIAEHLDVAGCLQVFDIALDKLKEATADKVFAVVTPEELVRVLDNRELWEFVEATKWYETDSEKRRALARELLAECKALKLGGGVARTLHAIEDAIGIDAYVEYLPKTVLAAIIGGARNLADGKGSPKGTPFAVDALDEVAGDLLSQHLPLPILVRPLHGFAKAAGWIVDPPKAEEKPEPVVVLPPPPLSLPPSGDADDVETKPTNPPPGTNADEDSGDPEVFVDKGGSGGSDEDAAEQDDAKNFDDEEDAQTRVGAIPRPPGSPPPLPGKGAQSGRRRG